jgi:hypothetical protein
MRNTEQHSNAQLAEEKERACTDKGYCLLVTQEYKLPKKNQLKPADWGINSLQ